MSEIQSGELLELVKRISREFNGEHSGVYEKVGRKWELVLSPSGERPITIARMKELMEEWLQRKAQLKK